MSDLSPPDGVPGSVPRARAASADLPRAIFRLMRPTQWVKNLLLFAALVFAKKLLVVDALALWAIVGRISEFGFSPNRVAALGENLILVVNLGWSAVLYARVLAHRSPFTPLERWQTAYVPVYLVWAWVVVVVFPLVFRFQ